MSSKRTIWMPEFFQKLQRKVAACGNEKELQKHSLRLVVGENGSYVYGLVNAASKWRVANSITSFNAAILPAASGASSEPDYETQISQELCNGYSAQMQISLAVFAFEAYANCFGSKGRDWYQHKQQVFPLNNKDLSRRLRGAKDAQETAKKIEEFLEKKNQRDRLKEFYGGIDAHLYDVCHFIRHSYAHGALRGYEGLIDVSADLKRYILDGIKGHVDGISAELN